MFDGPSSPLTQTFGLGLFQTATADDLAAIEAFYHERGAPVFHEVSPLAGVELAATSRSNSPACSIDRSLG